MSNRLTITRFVLLAVGAMLLSGCAVQGEKHEHYEGNIPGRDRIEDYQRGDRDEDRQSSDRDQDRQSSDRGDDNRSRNRDRDRLYN